MVMIPCFDASGKPMADADIDAAEWQSMVDLVDNYPPTRINPWFNGDFMINGEMTELYVRYESGTFTEIRVMGPAVS